MKCVVLAVAALLVSGCAGWDYSRRAVQIPVAPTMSAHLMPAPPAPPPGVSPAT